MIRRVRSLLWVVGLIAAAALLVLWRAREPVVALHDDGPARTAVSSAPAPFSPVAAAPSAAGHPGLPPPPSLPQASVATAEPANGSAGGAPEADVEQRQDAKIARGLTNRESGGVLVVAAPPGSVAGALHLQPGDLITAVDGHPLTSTEQFVQLYRTEGLPTELTVQRGGREMHVH